MLVKGNCTLIKDHEHGRRRSKTCADVLLDESKEIFPLKREKQRPIHSAWETPSESQFIHRQPMCKRRWRWDGNCWNFLGVCSSWYWSHPIGIWHGRPGPFGAPLERTHGRYLLYSEVTLDVRDLVTKAGNLEVSNLLFVHAWSGCGYNICYFLLQLSNV